MGILSLIAIPDTANYYILGFLLLNFIIVVRFWGRVSKATISWAAGGVLISIGWAIGFPSQLSFGEDLVRIISILDGQRSAVNLNLGLSVLRLLCLVFGVTCYCNGVRQLMRSGYLDADADAPICPNSKCISRVLPSQQTCPECGRDLKFRTLYKIERSD